ncbi:MAG TPA: DUF3551 domain-containing protein [Xanthobacteraceae bacterium]|nr:DUF3551 domain-containing protein [Xanthobacteraceae bacterium]
MRSEIILAAAVLVLPLATLTPASAHADEYCGFNPKPGAIVECGYTTLEGCQNDIGKGAMCFVNPYVALNTRRATPIARQPEAAS